MPVIRELTGAYAGGRRASGRPCATRRVGSCGSRGIRGPARAAGRMNFVPGARWAESAVGTNAPGTALAEDRPVQVFSAEHFRRPVQRVDLRRRPRARSRVRDGCSAPSTSPAATASPTRTAWASSRPWRGPPSANWPCSPRRPPREAVRLSALGRDEALLVADGRKLRLSRRHSEIAGPPRPPPRGPERRRTARGPVRGRDRQPRDAARRTVPTAKAVGPRTPRLPPLPADRARGGGLRHGGPAARLGRGGRGDDVRTAGRSCRAHRRRPWLGCADRLAGQLRAALLARADPGLLADWAYSPWGEDDLPVWQALADRPAQAVNRPSVQARLTELSAEQGLATGLQRPRA